MGKIFENLNMVLLIGVGCRCRTDRWRILCADATTGGSVCCSGCQSSSA